MTSITPGQCIYRNTGWNEACWEKRQIGSTCRFESLHIGHDIVSFIFLLL
jgi:hypothetical protein